MLNVYAESREILGLDNIFPHTLCVCGYVLAMTAPLKRCAAVMFAVALLAAPASAVAAPAAPAPPAPTTLTIQSLTTLLNGKGISISGLNLSSLNGKALLANPFLKPLLKLTITKAQLVSAIAPYLKGLPADVQAQIQALLDKAPNTISLGSLLGV